MISVSLTAQINLGTGSTDVGVAPVSTYYGYSYVQQIYTKQEINANAAGSITGLKFYLDPSMSLTNSSDWVVYLGHTSKNSFSSDTDWVPVSQLAQVFSGAVTNSNGVVEVTFATPFAYNNTDNLVIAAKENTPGYDTNDYDDVFYIYDGVSGSSLYYKNDTTIPDPASPPTGNLVPYKSVITITGLTASSLPACPAITYPANNALSVPLSPNITWIASPNATGYKVSMGTTPGGTNVVNQQSVATTSFTPSTPLSPNTNYYLRVTAVGAGGESAGCTELMFKTLPPPPANDDCSGALTLTVSPNMNCTNSVQGSTLGATDSGLVPDPCYGEPDDDVWFKFVATATSHYISLSNIVSVGSVPNDTDTYFQVFSGSCGNLSSILCSDPTASLVNNLTVGDTYYIRVYSYFDTGSNQSFNICVNTLPSAPVNDSCSGALVASVFPYAYTQSDAIGATNNSGFITACSNEMNDGTWFTFTGNGSTFTVSVNMPAGSSFDPQIGVYTGTCGSLVCEGTVDDGLEGGAETMTFATTAGTVYYVNVGDYSGFTDNLEGAFTINITNNSLGTSETVKSKNDIQVYPNPFTEVFHISNADKVTSASISDMSGRVVKTVSNPGTAIQAGELSSGMYMVTLELKDGSKQTLKIIKK
ncbi:T9SS type A sorting domain-containing protein [uncultured Chryseobacterium sp.]|uniref:T9SS type A sorting domain-containing protein n=1 Tax=uncultured Chryseobacterium sp. TaxID=259322 RepID=UPI0025ECA2D1|nr:T9SS type A sorting domain-containing protein [uncultured Chryseobacterium sp.]